MALALTSRRRALAAVASAALAMALAAAVAGRSCKISEPGADVAVHGLLVDIQTGNLEWLVNGYQSLDATPSKWHELVQSAENTLDSLKSMTNFNIGEMKFPETKIGEPVAKAEEWLSQKVEQLEANPAQPASPAEPVQQPKIPLPPPIRPRLTGRQPRR